MPPQTITILSDHGLHDREAFVINEGGVILRVSLNKESWDHPIPALFDTTGYFDYYGKLPPTIDVLDIGYYLPDGKHVKPEPDYRLNVMIERLSLASTMLQDVLKAVDICLTHYGRDAAPASVLAALHNDAKLLLANISFRETPLYDDADPSVLPIGVIIATSNEGPCAGCNEIIKTGEKMLLITASQKCYCTRECLDLHGDYETHPT